MLINELNFQQKGLRRYILKIASVNSPVRPPIVNIDPGGCYHERQGTRFQSKSLGSFSWFSWNIRIHPILYISKLDLLDCEDR